MNIAAKKIVVLAFIMGYQINAANLSMFQHALVPARHLCNVSSSYARSVAENINNLTIGEATIASAALLWAGYGFHQAAKMCDWNSRCKTRNSKWWRLSRASYRIGEAICDIAPIAFVSLKVGSLIFKRCHR